MDVKEAVQAARQYLTSVFQEEDTSSTRLEEVDYVHDDGAWKVTFSFLRPTGTMNSADRLFPAALGRGQAVRRDYKIVTVANATGQPRAVKHREVGASV